MSDISLFNKRNCIQLGAMEAYIESRLDSKSESLVKNHLENCPFCNDAVAGMKYSDFDKANLLIADIQSQIPGLRNTTKRPRTLHPVISIAASIAILIGAFFIYQTIQQKDQLAEYISTEDQTTPGLHPPKPQFKPIEKELKKIETKDMIQNSFRQKFLTRPTDNSLAPASSSETLRIADEMPEFHGGILALNDYIQQKTEEKLRENQSRSCGKVFVRFIVNAEGKVEHPKVLDSPNNKLSQYALELINEMPEFKPAVQLGKRVNIEMMLPVNFGDC